MGIRLTEGRGTRLNIPEGLKWFAWSAEKGNTFGACNLGIHYAKGWGVKKDTVMAGRSRVFSTPEGVFSFQRVPPRFPRAGVEAVSVGRDA